MSDPLNAQGIGTGHGATMTLLDPLTPTGAQNEPSPLGTGAVPGAPSGSNTYLIRDVQLHSVRTPAADMTSLFRHNLDNVRPINYRRFKRLGRATSGPITVTILLDTEVPPLQSEPGAGGDLAQWNFPAPGMENYYTYTWENWVAQGTFPGTNQPYRFGSGHVLIQFPIRNPNHDIPAAFSTAITGQDGTTGSLNIRFNTPTTAFVTNVEYGVLTPNLEHVARVTIQPGMGFFWRNEGVA